LEPENLTFGGGISETILNPFVFVAVLIAGVLIITLPRNKAIVPFLVTSILIPTDQILVLGPFHFPVIRILILFGLIRIFFSKLTAKEPIFSRGINGMDKAVMLLAVFTTVNGILLWQQSQAVIKFSGDLYSAFGVYFLLRFLIQGEEDVRKTLRVLACLVAFIAGIMIWEQLTGRNPLYAALGGVRNYQGTAAHGAEDKLRGTGSFAHPILAGTFGGFCFPLLVGLWWRGEKADRKYALLGIAAAPVMAFAANSSTALFGLIGGIIALSFWPIRRLMRLVRWAIVTIIVSLHIVMKAPVWHLISRVDLTGGSSSYHRYQLVNQCILHFSDWWLIGTKNYGDWGWDMWDLSNQYVATADTAGLVPFILLLAIIVFGFKYVGIARRAAEGNRRQELFIWALGASLFANVVAFFGISYFDQTVVAWYAILSMICASTAVARSAKREAMENAALEESDQTFPADLASGSIRSHRSACD
jgi:hypothetical protein